MKGVRLIKGGTVFAAGRLREADVLIEDGIVSAIGQDISAPSGADVLNARGLLVCHGFADLHVHFREPGYSYKETIRTGSAAAARGGYTTVCPMPNLNPVPDSVEHLEEELSIIRRDAVVDVIPYASITVGRKGLELVDMAALKDSCAGFSDDGSGVQSAEMMLAAMRRAASLGCIIAAHCEDNAFGEAPESEWKQIERDIELCRETGCRYHVCHISTRKSVELIRKAKAESVRITCETAPHYLVLSEADILDEGRFRMNPPVRTADDRDALVEGLADGTIDAVATDHAPHSAEEKSRGWRGSAMGIVGLETAFPVLYTSLVKTGKIPMERLLDALTDAPRNAFRIAGRLEPGAPADLTLIDPEEEYTIDSAEFMSKGRSTPFEGMRVCGRVKMTLKNGETIWREER